jgi:hypothetical protein
VSSSVSSSSPRSPPGRPSKKALAEELEAIKASVDKVKYPAFPRERNLIDLITFSTFGAVPWRETNTFSTALSSQALDLSDMTKAVALVSREALHIAEPKSIPGLVDVLQRCITFKKRSLVEAKRHTTSTAGQAQVCAFSQSPEL